MSETVSVELAHAVHLARACMEAALHIRLDTERLLVELREAGEDPFLLEPALAASAWAASGTRRIAAVVEAMTAWDAAPRPSCGVWGVVPAGRVDDDAAAQAAGADAIAALRSGDAGLVARLMSDWAATPAFVVSFGTQLTLSDVVPWLALAAEPGADVSTIDDSSTTVLALVGLLATGLSAATLAGTGRFSLDALLTAGAADGLDVVDAAMLFAAPGPAGAPDRVWSRNWLVDATALLVVPINAAVRDGGLASVGQRWGDTIVDPRLRILDALAGDPDAARAAFGQIDLQPLVTGAAQYLDGGAAMGAALVAATRPGEFDAAGAALVMQRLVDALSTDDPPPIRLADRMGEIAWPWIGTFRVDRADGRPGGIPTPIPALDERALSRYLKLASVSDKATTDLQLALDTWTGFHLAVSGPGPVGPQVLHDLGSVARFVSEAPRDSARSHAAERDRDREADQALLELAGNGIGALAARWWGGVADFAISSVVFPSVLVPRLRPDLEAEIEHLSSVPASVARDLELLEWQVLAHLWRHRVENGMFVLLPPPPPAALDALGELAPPSGFEDAAWQDYRQWRDAVADTTGVDSFAAAFGRDPAPDPDNGGG